MNDYSKPAAEKTAAILREKTKIRPAFGLLTGTGLGGFADIFQTETALPYTDIPGFPESTVAGHKGEMAFGYIGEHPGMLLRGRFHLYEGYSPRAVVFPIRLMREMGVSLLIVTNASGGVNRMFFPGDIMIIADHLNLTGRNPLIGPNDDRLGARFPDMSRAYDPRLAAFAEMGGNRTDIRIQTGVYAGLTGPSLETPAEIRYLQAAGADTVGFSTVMEVIAAVHAGMRILGLSVVTNVHDPDRPKPTTLEEVIAVAGEASPKLSHIVQTVLASA